MAGSLAREPRPTAGRLRYASACAPGDAAAGGALAAVVGTLEPTTDFDARFRPATNRLRTRWERVALAHREDRPLPPITMLERADGYYVVDGRPRVSVARALVLPDINAWVIPVMPSPLSAPRGGNGPALPGHR